MSQNCRQVPTKDPENGKPVRRKGRAECAIVLAGDEPFLWFLSFGDTKERNEKKNKLLLNVIYRTRKNILNLEPSVNSLAVK